MNSNISYKEQYCWIFHTFLHSIHSHSVDDDDKSDSLLLLDGSNLSTILNSHELLCECNVNYDF
jgi:hypothetical protein